MKKFFEKFTKKQLIIMSSIVAFLIVAIIVGTILLAGTECNHIYDNACDSTCNECGATRIVTHSYDDSQDPTCNTCGEERVVVHIHVYDNNCDETCNTCGETRTIEHAYTNTCDKVCNVCGIERVVTHTYDNACDTMCNICGEMQTAEHTYDNACDATCNVCGEQRSVPGHVYDNACDSSCNTCDNERTPADHVYTSDEDVDCDVCGFVRELTCTHEYDNNCDTTCNKCNDTRVVDDHVYDNDCDATCNVCNAERTTAAHVYDNTCDTNCNICDTNRTISHTYDNECDTTCNVCNEIRIVNEHVYDNACDAFCNECNYEREASNHIYDNMCDETCNVCNETRTAKHIYDNDDDVDCNICGALKNSSPDHNHEYEFVCSVLCKICGEPRVVDSHTYDNGCDATCNICNSSRKAPHNFNEQGICSDCNTSNASHKHTYNNDCDEICNYCSYVRVAPHVYVNTCSTTCDECGANREVVHIDANNDKQCDNCDIIIASDTEEVKIAAFINYFNNYLNSVHNIKREDLLSSNTKFSNIISSGSINVNLNEIVSIAIYDNFKHYIYNDGSELFIVQTENGEYSVSYYDGKYERDKINRFNEHDHENLFPLLTRTDVFINKNGTFSISSDYLKKVYRAWFDSDIEDTWIFGTYQISYYELNAWMDYADFVTEITCDENGTITSYNIVLKNDNKEYYNSTFVTSTLRTEVHFVMNTDVLTTVDFVYNKSTNGNAEFNLEIVDSYGTHTLTLKTDVTTNIPDFTSNPELDAALAETKNMFDNVLAMANKYGYECTMNNTCALVACYDEVYNMYAIFEYYNGKYYYLGCAVALDDIAACTATVNENHVLTVIQHHSHEIIKTFLTEKYADQYVLINNSNNIPAVFIYDNETNVYVLFVNIGDAFIYGAFVEEIPPEYTMFPIGTIDLANKTITV